ncbi:MULTISPECIES: hypothetical protein [Paenibacillus]|uniref:hypothetical protein n=1 Tax=Paenibacillus TaxID=44249 RepID=UPI0022B8CBDF|nr:hypothetical protein [Paenibacillus caseinilyticus]MCZ8523931.1 hypothetical protein [Paenibacillus caseinilyticus]
MLRYWKPVVFVPLILLTIGIYYANASAGNPVYVLHPLMGDTKEAAPVAIRAYSEEGDVHISASGSKYSSDKPLWEVILNGRYPSYMNETWKKLIQENRSFMRGVSSLHGIYEDANRLGYAEIKSEPVRGAGMREGNQFRCYIASRDKHAAKKTSFEVSIPSEAFFHDINLIDVQMDVQSGGQTMSLLTSNYQRTEGRGTHTEIHLYRVDLGSKQLMDDRILLSSDEQERTSIQVNHLSAIDPTKPSRYAAFEKRHSTIDSTTGLLVSDYRELFVYDLQTSVLEQVSAEPMAGLLKGTAEISLSSSDEEIFLTSWADGLAPRVLRYNIQQKKVTHDLPVSLAGLPLPADAILHYGFITNNRLYMLLNADMPTTAPPGVAIAELEQGKIVYEGAVSSEDDVGLRHVRASEIIVQ